MKIDTVVELSQRTKLSPLQRKILEYMEARSGDVFAYRDEGLMRDLGVKPSAAGFTLWALHKRGLIEKQEAGGKVYFGSRKAIDDLRRKLGVGTDNVFEEARKIREQIRATSGNLDTLAMLDEVREGR